MLLVSGAISSAGEHYIDIVGVTGSIPVSPTTSHQHKNIPLLHEPSAYHRRLHNHLEETSLKKLSFV